MKITDTPWGPAQYVDEIADGIANVSTASHGGVVLDEARAAQIPADIEPWVARDTRRFWEEDADWAVPYALWRDEFIAAGWPPDTMDRQARLALTFQTDGARRALAERLPQETLLLKSDDDWAAFWNANSEALTEMYGADPVEAHNHAYRAACDGGIEIGGGAAPLIHVRFGD